MYVRMSLRGRTSHVASRVSVLERVNEKSAHGSEKGEGGEELREEG